AHVGLAGQDVTREQHRRPGHVLDLPSELAQRALGGRAGWQGGGRILQVDGAQALDPPPYGGTQPGWLGWYAVYKDQPLRVLGFLGRLLGHLTILPDPAEAPCSRRLHDRASSHPDRLRRLRGGGDRSADDRARVRPDPRVA